jgi:hypothetical protein
MAIELAQYSTAQASTRHGPMGVGPARHVVPHRATGLAFGPGTACWAIFRVGSAQKARPIQRARRPEAHEGAPAALCRPSEEATTVDGVGEGVPPCARRGKRGAAATALCSHAVGSGRDEGAPTRRRRVWWSWD